MPAQSVTICAPDSGASAAILVSLGSNCYRLRIPHHGELVELLWSHPSFSKGQQRPSSSGIPILFPFPGRVQDAQLMWNEREFKLDEADGRGNAIHGFVLNRPWRIVHQTDNSLTTQFQASVDDASILTKWPADFLISSQFEIIGNRLTQKIEITNPDSKPLPWGLGTHPYFRIPLGANGRPKACRIQLPVAHEWQLENMNATGESRALENADDFQKGLAFADAEFDNVFSNDESVGPQVTRIIDQSSGLKVAMEFDAQFPYCVVYTPPHREAICMEPYTCVPDPFRLTRRGIESGLRVLEPGEQFSATITIRLES